MKKRHKHSLSHWHLFTCDMGQLLPIGVTEVLPGDTFRHSTSVFLRATPLLAPVMHPVQIKIHHWFVPYRLIWEQWEDFITGGPKGDSFPNVPVFDMSAVNVNSGSLYDYMGVPLNDAAAVSPSSLVSALPFRAYAKIYNENYRDEDLQDEIPVSFASGTDTTTSRVLLNANWEKDYFTSSRPFTQKGPEVVVPLVGDAPIVGLGGVGTLPSSIQTNISETDGSAPRNIQGWGSTVSQMGYEEDPDNPGFPWIRADLQDAQAINVIDLRRALAMQRFEEWRARYGSRYTEYLRSLGVRSSDARLQRPEYLGGGKQLIQFSEVLQTAPGNIATPENQTSVGELRGHGISAVKSNAYQRFFEEHGIVLSLMVVRPKTMYTQGLHRMFSRFNKEAYWQKEYEHIGQQEVYNREIYGLDKLGESYEAAGRFGFQDRYDEYRRMESRVSGQFQDQFNFWHMAREFATAPTLNSTFVTSTPTKRPFADQDEEADVLLCAARHHLKARRLLSKFAKSYTF